MSTLHSNIFDHINVPHEAPKQNGLANQVAVLPLNLIALIISHLDEVADLARVCQTSRVLHYMTLPQLYRNISLKSYNAIRYRDDLPEGQGSASPFAMGLNALVSRNVATLVHSLSLQGHWREQDLHEFSQAGRVPDDAMMLNIAVRAAVDRCTQLESFTWDLSTKLLSTVYYGLTSLHHLKSFHLRFPNSRSPRPTAVIPPMPNLESFTITHYDPLCFPDDVSLLFLHAQKLKTINLHFSPRMRDAGEPSVQVANFFRRNIAAQRPLKPTTFATYNLFALQNAPELTQGLDMSRIENVTLINTFGVDEDQPPSNASNSSAGMLSFFDQSWISPPKEVVGIKVERHDRVHRRHVQLLQRFTGYERLYMINARKYLSRSEINGINQSPTSSSSISINSPSMSTPPSSTSSTPARSSNITLRDTYIDVIITNHGSTLRHLIFPARWPLPPSQAERLFRACPRLTQLSFGMETRDIPQMRLLAPVLKKLWAIRIITPPSSTTTTAGTEPERGSAGQTLLHIGSLEDAMREGILSRELAAPGEFLELRYIGLADKVWEVGGIYEETETIKVNGNAKNGEPQHREEVVRRRRLKRISLEAVKDVEIWKMDSLDVV